MQDGSITVRENMRSRKPTFSRILFLNGFFHIVAFGISFLAIIGFLSRNEDPLFAASMWRPAGILVVGSAILIAVSIKSYRRISSLIEYGYETRGKIIEEYFHWGRGYVVYEYKHHGQIYRGSEKLSWIPSRKFKIGQEITVFLSHHSPSQALLYDLYQ